MIDTLTPIINMEQIPGEDFFVECLQKKIIFSIGNRQIKRGRLILFRRSHYYIHISLLTDKNTRESLEIPIPFDYEMHGDEGLMYFDYRLASLRVKAIPPIPEKIVSSYFNKILEISVQE